MATPIAAALPEPPVDSFHYEQGPKMPEPPRRIRDFKHNECLYMMTGTMRAHYNRPDFFIGGGAYLAFRPSDHPSTWLVPDCLIAFGVSPRDLLRDECYLIDDVGKPPDFVLEVGSRSTGRRDYTVKRAGYARFGVREYWRFDHTGGRFHGVALAFDLLQPDGTYLNIELTTEPDGMVWGYSPTLELDICWDNGNLRFYDPAAQRYLDDPVDMKVARDAAEAERDVAEAERITAEVERDAALARVRELEAQLGI